LAYPLATSPQATEQWTASELALRLPPQTGHLGRAASALAVLANPLHRREQYLWYFGLVTVSLQWSQVNVTGFRPNCLWVLMPTR